MLLAVEPRRGVLGDLLGTLEGKDAQLALSYIVWPRECPIRGSSTSGYGGGAGTGAAAWMP